MDFEKKRLPDFLVIGAGKSGTTSIDKYFNQHPGVFMARKEPSYFAIKNFDSINDPDDVDRLCYYPEGITDLEEYLKLFAGAEQKQLLGEVSPIYLNSDIAPIEIKNIIPDAKLIAILRHPAERLYSRYLHLANESQAPDLESLFDRSSIWHKRNDFVKEGYYAKNLQNYFNVFDENQLKVILYDDFKSSPVEVMAALYDFVGVDPNFKPDMTIQYNQSGFVKNKFLDKLYGRDGLINKSLKNVMPKIYAKLKSNSSLYKGLLKLRGQNTDRPPLSLNLKRRITQEFYLDDLKTLEKILHRSLNSWYEL